MSWPHGVRDQSLRITHRTGVRTPNRSIARSWSRDQRRIRDHLEQLCSEALCRSGAGRQRAYRCGECGRHRGNRPPARWVAPCDRTRRCGDVESSNSSAAAVPTGSDAARARSGMARCIGAPRHNASRHRLELSISRSSASRRSSPRLSVFSGGFNLELAERMARGRAVGGPYPHNDGYGEPIFGRLPFEGDPYLLGTEIGDYSLSVALSPLDGNVGEQLEALADKHLLQRMTGRDRSSRYLMLETIRDYGLEELKRRGESEAVHHAHAAAMMAFAEFSAPLVWSTHAAPWTIARVDDELGNLRVAIAWAESHGAAGAELVVRTVEPIWQYFQYRGMLVDVRNWLEKALTFSTVPPFPRAFSLSWLALVCWIQGDDAAASRAVDQAIALGKQLDLSICEARALVPTAAALAWRIGDLQEMASCIERALPVYQAWQDPIGTRYLLFSPAATFAHAGNADRCARGSRAGLCAHRSGSIWVGDGDGALLRCRSHARPGRSGRLGQTPRRGARSLLGGRRWLGWCFGGVIRRRDGSGAERSGTRRAFLWHCRPPCFPAPARSCHRRNWWSTPPPKSVCAASSARRRSAPPSRLDSPSIPAMASLRCVFIWRGQCPQCRPLFPRHLPIRPCLC